MSAEIIPTSAPDHSPNGSSAGPTGGAGWRHWVRRLLVCNPFFLCSAALLLFGVDRLSSEEKLFADEVHNLVFNFSALQCYGVLVVLTALVLARRRVWYDSSLLVVMDNGLALVPFMLVGQATLQGEVAADGLRLAWTLSLAGGLVAVARQVAVRRWYPQFNLPLRARLLGLAILAGNVALPLVFRPRMELDTADWQEENLTLWLFVLPMIAAGANLLPRPARYGGSNPERHWLPLFIYGLWIAGSAVHVWCIAHICNLPLERSHLAPLLCVVAWTLWNRISDCLPNPSTRLQQAMLGVTFIAPLPAFGETQVFASLVMLNLIGYLVLWIRSFDNWQLRTMVKHLAIASLALQLAGLPDDWIAALLPIFPRAPGVVLGLGFFGLVHSLRSRHPAAGLAGALASGLFMAQMNPGARHGMYVILQIGLVFLLLHSLRWSAVDGAFPRVLRWFAAMTWSFDSLLWTQSLGAEQIGIVTGGAALVTAGWMLRWRLGASGGLLALPIGAALSVVSAPAHWLLRKGSDGVLALVGSLALFSLGTVLAWTRHRWDLKHAPRAEP